VWRGEAKRKPKRAHKKLENWKKKLEKKKGREEELDIRDKRIGLPYVKSKGAEEDNSGESRS